MAGYKYGSSNPFLEEPVEDSQRHRKDGFNGDHEDFGDEENRLEQLRAKKRELEQRQIESTHRSLAVIAETQDIGNATAQELLVQGEKLDNAERKLDTIEYMTKITQRHITGIKSVFGSLKNWVRGTDKKDVLPPAPERTSSKLAVLMESNAGATAKSAPQASLGAPAALRLRLGDDYEYCPDDYARAKGPPPPAARATANARPAGYGSGYAQLDDNLELMSDGMKQLKDLAIGLGDEIEKQNVVIDRLKVKAERVDVTLHGQTSQIRKML